MIASSALRRATAVAVAAVVCALAVASAGIWRNLTDPHAQEVAPKIVVTPISQ